MTPFLNSFITSQVQKTDLNNDSRNTGSTDLPLRHLEASRLRKSSGGLDLASLVLQQCPLPGLRAIIRKNF